MLEAIYRPDVQKLLFEEMDKVQFHQIVARPSDMDEAKRKCKTHLFDRHRLEALALQKAGLLPSVIESFAYWRLTHEEVHEAFQAVGAMGDLEVLFNYKPSGVMHKDACSIFLDIKSRNSPLKDQTLRRQMQKIFARARQAVLIK